MSRVIRHSNSNNALAVRPSDTAQLVASFDGMDYPEPSQSWKEEVSQLRDRAAELAVAQEQLAERVTEAQALHPVLRDELDEMADTGRDRFLKLRQEASDEVQSASDRAYSAREKDLDALLKISEEKCAILQKMIAVPRADSPPPRSEDDNLQKKVKRLERRVAQLENENNDLRMRYNQEDEDRAVREAELKKLCVEQARELEALAASAGRGAGGSESTYATLGVDVSDSMTVFQSGSVNTTAHSGVRVRRATGPALAAGLKAGDLISWVTTTNRITDSSDLRHAVNKARLGDTISMMVQRGNQEEQINIEVGRGSRK
eukprot:NODE_1561_length_1293_cov_50.829331_g1547_i0.p1 GENE.NODE_1561_length_1293_cov_50.829331_g1547_i0~~NODE_1561_length_1293_cov_50.829331_g1547_i0.p1  ORF type:complete len:318 (+),score=58.78 NODE_1561_length_1293_cov_50.829331_g1547_i0:73-1026(+)